MGEIDLPAAAALAAMISAAPSPQLVGVTLAGDSHAQAALLAWGRHDQAGWFAGIAYLDLTWHSRALVTTWLPAAGVRPFPGRRYRGVPRVRLPDDPTAWPPLPPRYPSAPDEWLTQHRHDPFDPAGRDAGPG